jgi:hypothetical protein
MPETDTPNAAHRLVDIVVEEVSLVDRAANQHRFLVVKRSDPMADNATQSTPEPSATDTDVTDLAALPDEAVDFGRDDATAAADGSTPSTDARAEALLTALETLTAAVEHFDADRGSADFDALAAELRTIAESISPSPAPKAANGPKPETATPEKTGGAKEHLAAVQQALARLKTVASSPAPQSPTPASAPASQPATPASAAPSADSRLQTAVEALTAAVREQNQRLSVVEKQFGLPNSTPVGDRPVAKVADVSWPVDLNRPLDRDSVEKAVSFHEP